MSILDKLNASEGRDPLEVLQEDGRHAGGHDQHGGDLHNASLRLAQANDKLFVWKWMGITGWSSVCFLLVLFFLFSP